ncbi:hypothetical protein [Paraburkholderia sp. J8-2]|uniref:hypothetical protein n=1 Tax=Paraburkholderia sp. J8-2 TaxID=2805440 RepID=UPI002AB68F80|nr:hypothetical protein [Paraburkholderia sp. J8-2]
MDYMSIEYAASEQMTHVIDQLVELPQYEAMCQKLQRSNAEIQFDGWAVVEGGSSIGLATLRVVDAKTGLGTGEFSAQSIVMNKDAGDEVARMKLQQATADALAGWEWGGKFDKALASLVTARQKLR